MINREFCFADKALLTYPTSNPGHYSNKGWEVKIIGKVNNADAYVINAMGILSNKLILVELKNRYGYPIRHIELEWGKFNGYVSEFIVPGCELGV